MSFFNKLFKPKNRLVEYPPQLSIIRYTKSAWEKLFPKSSDEEWKEKNYPENIYDLTTYYVIRRVANNPEILDYLKEIKVLTIDDQYLNWLEEKGLTHSEKSVFLYVENRDNSFWDQRLQESQMNEQTHILGLSFTSLITNAKNNRTQYRLSQEAIDKLADFIKTKYKTDNVYIPGWIIKGSDTAKYTQSIDVMANEYFNNHRRIRLGQCEEQAYSDEEMANGFIPLPFFIPIVYKVNVTKHNHHVCSEDIDEQEKYEYSPNLIHFTDSEMEYLSEIISTAAPGIVECAPSLTTREAMALIYKITLLRKELYKENRKFY